MTENSHSLEISCRGKRLDCSLGPVIMGILNVTPDSFYDGGRYVNVDDALHRARVMAAEGALIVDVGGASSRPAGRVYGAGAAFISPQEEMDRVLPVVEAIADEVPEVVISVDTFQLPVAEAALSVGAHMINDISGLRAAPKMAPLAAEAGAALVLMHAIGLPGEMPHEYTYASMQDEVYNFLNAAVEQARAEGVRDVIVDPGFGFGKSPSDNLRLINRLHFLKPLSCPIMVGVSRKSTIGAAVSQNGTPVPLEDRLFGTLGATAVAALNGAHIVRTHDVRPTKEMLRVLAAVVNEQIP